MSEVKKYKFHKLSTLFPLMKGEEFDALVNDIKEHGLLESITLFEGKIIDGRNRYRACLKLGIPGKFRNLPKGMTAFNYVISENLRRRHLTSAQLAELALVIIEVKKKEIAKEKSIKTKERQDEKTGKLGKSPIPFPKNEIGEQSKPRDAYRETAKELHISEHTISKAKKIKEVAETDKSIAEQWEDAKRGDLSVAAVYKEVQEKEIIEELPDDLKVAVKKEKAKVKKAKQSETTYEAKITVKEAKAIKDLPNDVIKAVIRSPYKITPEEAKVIAEIDNETLRKQEIAERELAKKRQESAVQKKKDLADGKTIPKPKYFDKDASKVQNVEDICKRAVKELTFAGLEGYGKTARDVCIEMMKRLFEHLRNELKNAGEVAPTKVIDVDAD